MIIIAVRWCVTLLYYCHPYDIFCIQVCIMIQSVILHNLWPHVFLTRVDGRSHAHRVRPTPYKSSSSSPSVSMSWALKSKISSLMTIVVKPLICRRVIFDSLYLYCATAFHLICAADVYLFTYITYNIILGIGANYR